MHQDEQDNAPAAADDDDDPEAQMMKLMGFGGFETTKGKHVAGADMSGANVKKQPKYRQYMNRRGGFNRPLDKV
jgi:U4/U6.U5 tri-snRNP-associated protein 3